MTIGKHISKMIWLLNIHKLIIETLFVFRRILHVLFWEVFCTDFVFVWTCQQSVLLFTLPPGLYLCSVRFFFMVVVEFLNGIYVFNLSCWLYFTYQCMHIIHEFLLTTSSFHCLELFKITWLTVVKTYLKWHFVH